MNQLPLDFSGPPEMFDSNLCRKADKWIAKNRRAFSLFRRFAIKLGNRNARFGFKLIAERVRYESLIRDWEGEYKINNNYVAYIGRRILQLHVELRGLVEMRRVDWGKTG